MSVTLIAHPDCLDHDTGPNHPERPARFTAVTAALEATEFQPLLREQPEEASVEALCAVHHVDYVDHILSLAPAPGTRIHLDADTIVSARSVRVARLGAGAAIMGVDAVMQGWARAAFAAMRPPGHHAEPDRAMGFCLFSNAAIAAVHGRQTYDLRRVAVVDFDVHHGNGTQAFFEKDADLFYASSHQYPCYPGTGRANERGIAGNIVNAPLPPGSGPDAFRAAWSNDLLPALEQFRPELLIVSAGFDADYRDPLAQLNVTTPDFAWLTSKLVAIADKHCNGRIVSLLEGGYDLTALGEGVAAHVRALMRA